MKTTALAATAILALLVAGVAATASAYQFQPHSAGQANSSAVAASHANGGEHGAKGRDQDRGRMGNPLNLTVGKTLTLSGLTGRYVSATNSSVRGNASGTLTAKVTAAFKEGYVLTISSGAITLGTANYTITGGSVELVPSGLSGTGTGTTSSSGQFLIRITIYGTSTTTSGRAALDLTVGGSEYLVSLRTPVAGEQASN